MPPTLTSEDVKKAYAIVRGSILHGGKPAPPHWDHLTDDLKAIIVGVFAFGMHFSAEVADSYGEVSVRDDITEQANALAEIF